jgi:hypothetical protein
MFPSILCRGLVSCLSLVDFKLLQMGWGMCSTNGETNATKDINWVSEVTRTGQLGSDASRRF